MLKFIHLLDHDIIERGDDMRRIYDLPIAKMPEVSFKRISLKTFASDAEKEGHTYSRKSLRLLDGAKRFSLVLSNLRMLRKSDLILCSEGDYYWILILLRKVRLLNTKPTIWRFIFKSGSVQRVLPKIQSETKFRIGVVSRAQKKFLANQHVRYFPWRIDIDWFKPDTLKPSVKQHYFIPGNAYRDDEFVKRLAREEYDVGLIRCGRSSHLKTIYEDEVRDKRLSLAINPPHSEYLDLLHKSRCVLLPITECDEPAGLTALLEALACGIPVVATDSLGIQELAAELPEMIKLLKSNDPRLWYQTASELGDVPPHYRQRAIDFVRKNHAIGGGGIEFFELLN